MRNLFLVLLLGNLLFWGWRVWVAPPELPAMELRTPGKEPRIALLQPAGGPTAGMSAASGDCWRVGPIADPAVADALRARLDRLGFSPVLRNESGQIWVGYWVQLEPVPTREEADAMVARLSAGGLPDAYVVQTQPTFAVSLGVFRDRERADAVVATASSLGFRSQVGDRYRAGMQAWLTVRLPPGRKLPLQELGQQTGQILRSEPADCPAG
ncbi:MAG: SPOR domain-containing protein [Gammaproteobacteria bacterium]|nr:SPOR domain-containing protein [Gammaproteobacteria bacterium]